MKTNQVYQFEESLNKIKRVEASDFLLTRIQQRIANQQENNISKSWAFTLSASFVLLFAINIVAFSQWNSSANTNQNLVQEMNLSTNNNLYN